MLEIGKTGWIEKENPTAEDYDAIVKPLALAPCTSDIHTVFEGGVGQRHDMMLGHEAVGEVVEVGDKVKDFKPGDRVVVPAITPDWNTLEIQNGRHQHSGGMLAGWKFSNIKDGVFAERFHVNDADMNLAHLPEDIPLEAAVMLTDMMTTGFHGTEMANVEFGDTVAVIGIGPVGLMAVASASLRGAGRIITVGSRQVCVDVAKEYGATENVNYKEGDIVKQVMDLTDGKGVDATIIAGGPVETTSSAVKITKPNGTISNINYFGSGENVPVPRAEWGCGMSHKTITGGLCPGGRVRMEKLIEMIKHKRIDPAKMATHVFEGLDKVEEALMLMKDKPRDLIKPVVLVN